MWTFYNVPNYVGPLEIQNCHDPENPLECFSFSEYSNLKIITILSFRSFEVAQEWNRKDPETTLSSCISLQPYALLPLHS